MSPGKKIFYFIGVFIGILLIGFLCITQLEGGDLRTVHGLGGYADKLLADGAYWLSIESVGSGIPQLGVAMTSGGAAGMLGAAGIVAALLISGWQCRLPAVRCCRNIPAGVWYCDVFLRSYDGTAPPVQVRGVGVG